MGIRTKISRANVLSTGSIEKKKDTMRIKSTILKNSRKGTNESNTIQTQKSADRSHKDTHQHFKGRSTTRTDLNVSQKYSVRFRRRRRINSDNQNKHTDLTDTKETNSIASSIGSLQSELEIIETPVDHPKPVTRISSFWLMRLVPFFVIFGVIIRIYDPPISDSLGDETISEVSSHRFFQSVDRDGDGILEARELAYFLEDSIGGTPFDTTSEVNDEVHEVMQALDRDKQEGLEEGDVFAYWNHLESLTNADEVKEWIENALQLPQSVGDIFKENRITVYDFPELVAEKGVSIRDDLGITEKIFHKKILRHIHARLLGVGGAPEPLDVSKIRYTLESCSTVSFSWEKPNARGFPVHSYRVQRRDVELHSQAESSIPNFFSGPQSHPSSQSQWITIYNGREPRFHDNSLQLGHSYKYRIQAWNSVDRSAWVDDIDITKLLKSKKCTKRAQRRGGNPVDRSASINHSGPVMFLRFLGTVISIISTLVYLAATLMRFKRATAPSTLTATKYATPMFWLINSMNNLSKRTIGIDILPNPSPEKSKTHDISIKAIGLNGYKKTNSTSDLSETDNPSQRRRKMKKASSERSLQTQSSSEEKPLLLRRKSSSSLSGHRIEEWNDEKSESTVRPHQRKRRIFSFYDGSSLETIDSAICDECPVNSLPGNQRNVSINSVESIDNDKICNYCRKTYKLGKRYKHHCARCLATFCHKHGRTSHSNFTSCKVPGDCVCNICLQLEKDC